jgi:hypothetical protein
MAGDAISVERSSAKRGLIAGALALGFGFFSAPAWGWGERGHHVICEAATRLVHDPELRAFLVSRSEIMGHVCNIPDTFWRGFRKGRASGNSSHFINPERIGLSAKDIPLDYSKVLKLAEEKKIVPLLRVGSLWWRADQLYRLAVADGKKAKISSRGPDIYDLLVDLGLLGHFVGDASMPYHSTGDFDGWKSARGGIHCYYGNFLIDAQPLDLLMSVFQAAKNQKATELIDSEVYVVQRMKDLSVASLADLARLEKADDQVIRKRSEKSMEPNFTQEKVAVRLPASEAVPIFGDLPALELGRAAELVAELWDRAYAQGGRPNLSKYKSWRYPFTPSFIWPDYLPGNLLHYTGTLEWAD